MDPNLSTNPDNGTVHLIRHNKHYDLLLPQKDQETEKEKEKHKEKDISKETEKATNRTRAKGSSHAKVNQRLGHICTTTPIDETQNKNNERLGHKCITTPNDEEQDKENKKTKDTQLKKKQQGRGLGYGYGNLHDIRNIIDSNTSGTITRSSLRKKQ